MFKGLGQIGIAKQAGRAIGSRPLDQLACGIHHVVRGRAGCQHGLEPAGLEVMLPQPLREVHQGDDGVHRIDRGGRGFGRERRLAGQAIEKGALLVTKQAQQGHAVILFQAQPARKYGEAMAGGEQRQGAAGRGFSAGVENPVQVAQQRGKRHPEAVAQACQRGILLEGVVADTVLACHDAAKAGGEALAIHGQGLVRSIGGKELIVVRGLATGGVGRYLMDHRREGVDVDIPAVVEVAIQSERTQHVAVDPHAGGPTLGRTRGLKQAIHPGEGQRHALAEAQQAPQAIEVAGGQAFDARGRGALVVGVAHEAQRGRVAVVEVAGTESCAVRCAVGQAGDAATHGRHAVGVACLGDAVDRQQLAQLLAVQAGQVQQASGIRQRVERIGARQAEAGTKRIVQRGGGFGLEVAYLHGRQMGAQHKRAAHAGRGEASVGEAGKVPVDLPQGVPTQQVLVPVRLHGQIPWPVEGQPSRPCGFTEDVGGGGGPHRRGRNAAFLERGGQFVVGREGKVEIGIFRQQRLGLELVRKTSQRIAPASPVVGEAGVPFAEGADRQRIEDLGHQAQAWEALFQRGLVQHHRGEVGASAGQRTSRFAFYVDFDAPRQAEEEVDIGQWPE